MSSRSRQAVLLHGLGRSPASMRPIERLLSSAGYDVLNLGYPSRSASISELARRVEADVAQWAPIGELDLVTHSLGGVLVRQAVAEGHLAAERVRRVVMLGPPNAGSELADQLPRWPILGPVYRRFTGPAGAQLGTDARSVPAQLPPVPFETGVIAGTRSYNPIFSAVLGGRSDGKVRVERTHVAGMRDFVEVAYWHPLLMVPQPVHALVVRFLETGRFQ